MDVTSTPTLRMRALLCLLASCAAITAACATAPRAGRPNGSLVRPAAENGDRRPPDEVPADSFEAVIGKIRHLSQHARPVPKHVSGPTIESTDPRLAAALLALAAVPSGPSHCRVAQEYVRLGILDAAYDHYRRATRVDPRNADAYSGLARIWRDWNLPALGLGDAYRAVYFAPDSAEAQNTLGTLFQALGQHEAARAAYDRAIALRPDAAYALNNRCYLSILEGRPSQGVPDCRRAITLEQELTAARHNLALAYAASGQPELARRELLRTDSTAVAYYNLGIIHLARRDYAAATAAFDTACEAQRWPRTACARAQQLRIQADGRGGERQP